MWFVATQEKQVRNGASIRVRARTGDCTMMLRGWLCFAMLSGVAAQFETPHEPNAVQSVFKAFPGALLAENAGVTVRDPVPLSPENIKKAALTSMEAFNVSGLSVAVVGPNGLIACEGVGTAGNSKPVTCNDTLFQIASDTKQFTAVMALMAEEDGLLSIDEDIRTFWPQFNPPERAQRFRNTYTERRNVP